MPPYPWNPPLRRPLGSKSARNIHSRLVLVTPNHPPGPRGNISCDKVKRTCIQLRDPHTYIFSGGHPSRLGIFSYHDAEAVRQNLDSCESLYGLHRFLACLHISIVCTVQLHTATSQEIPRAKMTHVGSAHTIAHN